MRAAIYTRYSSENQRETSLEDQERLCRQEAEHLGYTVTKVYKDAALSGQLGEDQRPGFQAVMDAAKRREFDVLIADDASRLSRNAGDALKIQERLRFLGIGLVARSDGINTVTNPKNSELVFGIKSVINREFLRDLGEKTWRGLEGRARAGLNPGGLPYGYRSEPVYDGQKNINGYKRTVYEPEARSCAASSGSTSAIRAGSPIPPARLPSGSTRKASRRLERAGRTARSGRPGRGVTRPSSATGDGSRAS